MVKEYSKGDGGLKNDDVPIATIEDFALGFRQQNVKVFMFGYFHRDLMCFEAIKENAELDKEKLKRTNRAKEAFGHEDEEELKAVTKPTIIKFPKFTKPIYSVSCGADHVLALTIDKEMYSWGSNNYGALGFGKGYEENVKEPTRLEILDHKG